MVARDSTVFMDFNSRFDIARAERNINKYALLWRKNAFVDVAQWGGWCDGPLCKCAWYYVQTLFRMFVLMLHFLTWSQIYGKRSLNLVLSFRCLGLSESAPERRRNTIPCIARVSLVASYIEHCVSLKSKPYPSASFFHIHWVMMSHIFKLLSCSLLCFFHIITTSWMHMWIQ